MRVGRAAAALVWVTIATAGCGRLGFDQDALDGGSRDAGSRDAGPRDAGPDSATGSPDAGADAGAPDAGGTATDGGVRAECTGDAFSAESIGAGLAHTCAITLGCDLYCWGANAHGALGDGSASADRPIPALVGGPPRDWYWVDGGNDFTCALDWDLHLYCWGIDTHGQLGTGSAGPDVLAPVAVAPDMTWEWLTVGVDHACGIESDRSLWCWGINAHGALGVGDEIDRFAPTRVGTDTWTRVSAAFQSTCAIRDDHTLWCWGANDNGKLGLGVGAAGAVLVPTQLPGTGSIDWAAVASSITHACAVDSGGNIYCWGLNAFGEVGTGDRMERDVATLVPLSPLADFIAEGGFTFSLVIAPTGDAWSWGIQPDGTVQLIPRRVDPGVNVALAAGRNHDCLVTSTGLIRCRGVGAAVGPAGDSTMYVDVPLH